MSKVSKLFVADKRNLNLFFKKFALIKILATESQNVEYRDSVYVYDPTSIGLTTFNFNSRKFKEKLNAEIDVLWDRFLKTINRVEEKKRVEEGWKWLDKHKELCRKFFDSYSTHINELNATNQQMINALGFSVFASSTAQSLAEIALILTGVGLPTEGLTIKAAAENTMKEFGKKFIVSFAAGSSIEIIENWKGAKKADAILVVSSGAKNGATSYPCYGADVTKKLAEQTQKEAKILAKAYKEAYDLPISTNAQRQIRNSAMSKNGLEGTIMRQRADGYAGTTQALTAIGYLLAVKGTYDSLNKLVKHCNYEL